MYNPHLDTFLIVANCGSFSKAAEYLYVTPSAVIQQINALESKLNVTLFSRSNKGVALTKQGAYLKSACVGFIKTGQDIQDRLRTMQDSEFSLTLGTSLHEKCRVFYDFWVRFTQREENYKVQLQTIDTRFPLSSEIDFVEAIRTDAPWQSALEYYELCKSPYGIAAAKDHPLNAKTTLTSEDIRPYTVILQRQEGSRENLSWIREWLHEHKIQSEERSGFDGDVVWDASIKKQLLVIPLCFRDILFDMDIKPVNWDFSVSYGLFYQSAPSALSQKFLEFVRQYHQQHPEITDRLIK